MPRENTPTISGSMSEFLLISVEIKKVSKIKDDSTVNIASYENISTLHTLLSSVNRNLYIRAVWR